MNEVQLERPSVVPSHFQPVFDNEGLVKGWAEPNIDTRKPPKVDKPVPDAYDSWLHQLHQAEVNLKEGPEFDFTKGNLGKVKRLVQRNSLKDRVKLLELIIRSHQPLIKAMQITQKAFQAGVQEGIRQVALAEAEKAEKQGQQEQQSEQAENASTPEELQVEKTESTIRTPEDCSPDVVTKKL